jgi:hypothetical protein
MFRPLQVGSQVCYTRHSDNTSPQGTIRGFTFDLKIRKNAQSIDGDIPEVMALLELDPEWISHVGHPVTIDCRRLRFPFSDLEPLPPLDPDALKLLSEDITPEKILEARVANIQARREGKVIVAVLDGEDSVFRIETPEGEILEENPYPFLHEYWVPGESWSRKQMELLGFGTE